MTAPANLLQSENVLQPLGRSLVTALYAASKAIKFYPLENATVQNALDQLHRTATRVLDREEGIQLRLIGDFMFLNDARLRLDLSDYVSFSYVAGLFRRHGVGEVVIERGVERSHLVPLLSLMVEEASGGDAAYESFLARLEASPARHLDVGPAREVTADLDLEADDRAKEAAKVTYFQSVHVAREVLTDTRLGRAVNLRRVKRAVQSIVDQVLNNETSILGMTTLRDFDEYTFTHSVNVCIFSVVIGQRLGLSKLQLYELGLGALFHDIGKQRIDPAIVTKTGGLTAEEWVAIKRHPTEGMLSLFWMRGLSDVPYRAMLMAYEHHMRIDLSGYPKNKRERSPTLFSRIVATADGFDAATSKRSYQSEPYPPDEVLREMRENPERGFDPLLVKALISATGVFPVGTLAILDSYEMAVVTARNPDRSRVHQPVVRIVSDGMGVMIADPPTVDLSETDPATGKPRRTIVKTVDPDRFGIRVTDYIL
ncbi:MAG: HD domain-containing protein [Gemmatimonadota bacterium]|jgi:HD-GYP domain-containing protein (c-di-GMP phosphodiesterase class II)